MSTIILYRVPCSRSVTVTFVDKDGAEQTVAGAVGKSVLEVAHANDVELEGACEGSLACSTCHVIVEDENMFKQLGERRCFDATLTLRLHCFGIELAVLTACWGREWGCKACSDLPRDRGGRGHVQAAG